MTRLGWLAFCVCVLVHASVRADEPLNARVLALLEAGIETWPEPALFASLGPDVVPALIAAFERDDAAPHARLRALDALAALDDPRCTTLLLRVIASAGDGRSENSVPLTRSALSLRRALEGLSQRELRVRDAERALPLLQHADESVRAAAARVLVMRGSKQTRAALEASLQHEPSAQVRAALTAALTGRSARGRAPRLVRPRSAPPPR
jgi:hypothetical protein